MKIKIKRAYEKPTRGDGFRVLVDRLWPRGLSKDSAKINLWMKEVAPSSKLRTWFHEDKIKRLTEFEKRYKNEIGGTQKVSVLKKVIKKKLSSTLVTAVKDFRHSHIPILLKALTG